MKLKFLKYLVLVVFGILLIKNYFPFGDYCKGLIQGIQLIFFGGLFVVLFSVFTIVNLFQVYKKTAKFEVVPIFIFAFFSLSLVLLMKLNHEKFWVKSIWEGSIQFEDKPQNGVLFLFKNNTFEATNNYADFSCTYVGNYEIKNDTLHLKRDNIITETDSLFTNWYLFNDENQELLPINKSFTIIKR